jgi:starch phosphorylase
MKTMPTVPMPKSIADNSQAVSEEASFYERHLIFQQGIEPEKATPRQRLTALAHVVRHLLMPSWLQTQETYDRQNPKQVYYLSLEFLIGRSLANNVCNLGIEAQLARNMQRLGLDWRQLAEYEPDAGLGNGGLGRLAACFLDSFASLQIPAMGYGLRYQYGMFRQEINNGFQVEHPDNWLRQPDPWELVRWNEHLEVQLGCSYETQGGMLRPIPNRPHVLLGIPYDRPVVGYGDAAVGTLRLWEAGACDYFDFSEFSKGDFLGAVLDKQVAETLTRVLYPDDSTVAGRALRFAQEYFLVVCSLNDIVARFRRRGNDWPALPDKVAIQLNDTHPGLAIAELMRILLDRARLGWDDAWDLTQRTLAYTNHTLLPEALEKWPVHLVQTIAPRHMEIVYEINRRFLDDVKARFPNDPDRVRRMSLIEEEPTRQVRIAYLAVVGTHAVNGVSAIHSRLLRETTLRDFAEMHPERFHNVTNGVTPRRWLRLANPELSQIITETLGSGWITDLGKLRELVPLAEDADFRSRFRKAKRDAKTRFAAWLKTTTGQVVDPDAIFDCQVKRIHAYKRQLLNVLHIIVLYNRLRNRTGDEGPPRTFFFAGKAAPAYHLAKLIIKLIHNVAAAIDADPLARGRLQVLFLPNYGVTLAERLIPASDVSEQISTAGYEASGTSNMKFMMNGALTVGTRDGATIEMAQEAGEDNFFLFGLTAEQVLSNRGWYNPHWHYDHEPETRAALDLIFRDYFSRGEQGIFAPIRELLMDQGDFYMHLADLTAYTETQRRVGQLYADAEGWSRKGILNVAYSGIFSSDRAIREYAANIWNAQPCPLPASFQASQAAAIFGRRGQSAP